jgi:DNA-binding response OmpR family regulator
MNGATIIIIEDQDYILDNMVLLLVNEGHIVHAARDGNSGLDLILKYKPDLIISDILMPGRDGYELLREVRNNPHTAHIPFIFITARSMDTSIKHGLNDYRADDYLVKPFTIDELLVSVHKILNRSGNFPAL